WQALQYHWVRARDLESERTCEQAERGENTRASREHDARDAKLARDADRVCGAGAAERDHRAAPVVDAALRGVDAERARHVLVDHFVDTGRRALEFDAQRARHVFCDRALRERDIELHRTAEEALRIVEPKQHV